MSSYADANWTQKAHHHKEGIRSEDQQHTSAAAAAEDGQRRRGCHADPELEHVLADTAEGLQQVSASFQRCGR